MTAAPIESDGPKHSLMGLMIVLLRHRVMIAAASAVTGFLVAVTVLLSPRHYTAEARFAPQSEGTLSALGGLASQIGFSIPGTDATQSPDFYASLLTSREMVGAVVDSRYEATIRGHAVAGTLVDIFESAGPTPALQRENAIDDLLRAIDVGVSAKTGLVQVRVTTKVPGLSKAVTERFLALVNQFNLKARQSQAGSERVFTEQRVQEVSAELKAAEDRQQEFLQHNRDFQNSPQLKFAYDRLAREVSMRQDIYTALVQSFEHAKIEEIRDTPVITVVEHPEVPARPDSRGGLRKLILGCLLGAMLGLFLALWREFERDPGDEGQPEVDLMLRLRRDFVTDLRHPIRALRREFVAARPGRGRP